MAEDPKPSAGWKAQGPTARTPRAWKEANLQVTMRPNLEPEMATAVTCSTERRGLLWTGERKDDFRLREHDTVETWAEHMVSAMQREGNKDDSKGTDLYICPPPPSVHFLTVRWSLRRAYCQLTEG